MQKSLKALIVSTCCTTVALILMIIGIGLIPLVWLMAAFWAVIAAVTVWLVIDDRRQRA